MNTKHQTQAIEKQAQAIREIREEMVSELNELEGMNVTCEHGFIGACSVCDGSGQTPEQDDEYLHDGSLRECLGDCGRILSVREYETSRVCQDCCKR